MKELIALFEKATGETPLCEKIKGEGSNRKYYRLKSAHHSLIGVEGTNEEEDKAFIRLAKHFTEKGLNTPKLILVSDDNRFYLQEDLGDDSLFSLIQGGIKSGQFSEKEESLILKTIALLPDLQFKGAQGLDFSVCFPIPEMDRRSILWDLNYFKYDFLKLTGIEFSEPKLEEDFEKLCDAILAEPSETFLYRDFQSRNIMIKEGVPYFIDFQGGRKGPIYYDVASFAWQAKANFPDSLREKIVETYIQSASRYTPIDGAKFRERLSIFVLFRTIQVLGAYGFRGLYERKPHFIESIPFALNNLKSLLQQHAYPGFPYLVQTLRQLTELPQFQNKPLPDNKSLKVKVFSFSYKKGIPTDDSGNGGGYVFDCRGVHNPGKYDQYKPLNGLDKPVIDFLESNDEIKNFLEHIYALADAHVLRYMERGFTSLMFSCGCTGGRHRSVYSAQHLAEHISRKFGVEVQLEHIEQGISKTFPAR
ncbi:MAG: phosphotransferase [Paludibacteraceae bacterium]|nr:phosphotransferase [Paludibacteraceae bacterium]